MQPLAGRADMISTRSWRAMKRLDDGSESDARQTDADQIVVLQRNQKRHGSVEG